MEEKEPICINGKYYPMWSQFVHRKEEWIGGVLVDYGDSFHRAAGFPPITAEILDVKLTRNGKDSAFFSFIVKREDGGTYECGGDVSCLGISGRQEGDPWLVFSGYGGQKFKIKKKES